MTSQMKTIHKNNAVMIIGGGVAGMAAAEKLIDHQISVHLIEKENHLGGHAASLACMATDTCQHCASCLGYETAGRLSKKEHLTIHLNTTIDAVEKKSDGFLARLNKKEAQTIMVDDIILATGYDRHTPDGLIGQMYHKSGQILTTADLNTALNGSTLNLLLSDSKVPHIAFIQCVGSRNREKGKDYCSQVCCKISLRQITKLLHFYPDAQISLFYIDLQVIDQETRTRLETLSGKVNLVQGVPREFFDTKEKGKISMIHEDMADGRRKVAHFDLVVLSVGMDAGVQTGKISEMLDVSSDQWGFVNGHVELARKNIYAAGCAAGPADILTARQQGVRCAEQIIQKRDLQSEKTASRPQSVAVMGDGKMSLNTAFIVKQSGYSVSVFKNKDDTVENESGIRHISMTDLISVKGTIGDFTIMYKEAKTTITEKFAAVIVTEPAGVLPAAADFNLPKTLLYTLHEIVHITQTCLSSIPDSIVFWLDYSDIETKAASRASLLVALMLSRTGRQVTIIMKHMQVHGLNGQTLYDRARRQGIRFLRIHSSDDVTIEKKKDVIHFQVKDMVIKQYLISFDAGWLVIPDKIRPGDQTGHFAGLLNATLSSDRYLFCENVRYKPANSLRKGVFYLGTTVDETGRTGDMDESDYYLAIDMILSRIRKITQISSADKPENRFMINAAKCKKCLTCYRVCPHGAISLKDGISPWINPDACFQCGMCFSECPAFAIDSQTQADSVYLNMAKKNQILVFACERSGAIAAEQADISRNINIQTVPCACRVSRNLLMKGLEAGAEKIILACCHDGNCQSMHDSRTIKNRMEAIPGIFGVNKADICFYPVAANEPARLEAFFEQLAT